MGWATQYMQMKTANAYGSFNALPPPPAPAPRSSFMDAARPYLLPAAMAGVGGGLMYFGGDHGHESQASEADAPHTPPPITEEDIHKYREKLVNQHARPFLSEEDLAKDSVQNLKQPDQWKAENNDYQAKRNEELNIRRLIERDREREMGLGAASKQSILAMPSGPTLIPPHLR